MDLNNSANWILLTSQTKRVTDTSVHPIYKRSYIPLQPSLVRVTSPIIQIVIGSEEAPPRWNRAGWISFYSMINGQSTLIEKKGLQLGEYNLLNFPFYGEEVIPFEIEIEFPFWIKDITFSVWEYQDGSGRFPQPGIDQALQILEDELNGETITLTRQSVVQEGDLYYTTFVGTSRYVNFEIGRFRSGSRVLSDPIIQVSGNQIIATFTSNTPIPDQSITVTIKPT